MNGQFMKASLHHRFSLYLEEYGFVCLAYHFMIELFPHLTSLILVVLTNGREVRRGKPLHLIYRSQHNN